MVHAMLYDDDDARHIRSALGGVQVVVPPHFHIECVNAIRGSVLGGKVSLNLGTGMVAELADIPFHVVQFGDIADYSLNNFDNISAYDNAYVTVAQMFDAPLITRDAGLRKAAAQLIKTIP